LLESFKAKEGYWIKQIRSIFNPADDYIEYHAIRFAELLHVIDELNTESALSSVLDCGHKHSGLLINRCFASQFALYDINIEDATDVSYLSGHFCIDLERDDLDQVDLNTYFELIIFTEVVEHLRANPVKVLRFLGKHLAPNGKILLTTPNFYNHHNLAKFKERHGMQPQVPYDLKYSELYFHHVHEYCAHEIFVAAQEARLSLDAFWFSDCWDRAADAPIDVDALSNMVFIFSRGQ